MNRTKTGKWLLASGALLLMLLLTFPAAAADSPYAAVEKKVQEMMREADIPGLTLVIVREGQPDYIQGFGYADLNRRTPVTPDTFFELASCSKAFTALALVQLEEKGAVRLSDPVSKYLPWFRPAFKKQTVDVTLEQLLHHTSGLPTDIVSLLREDTARDALERASRDAAGVALKHRPGTVYEYCTLNYDVIGAVIEKVSGISYEEYMSTRVFQPLGLTGTSVGAPLNKQWMATGYKFGFHRPQPFQAPLYRGNYPAGYIVSNGRDIATWLKAQIGLIPTPLAGLIGRTHEPNIKVPVDRTDLSYYAMGWKDYVNDNDILDHAGNNPNFTAYFSFSRKEKVGVGVLVNANSTATNFIGYAVMNALRRVPNPSFDIPKDTIDRTCTVMVYILGVFMLVLLAFFVSIFVDLARKRRTLEPLRPKTLGRLLFYLVIFLPFAGAVYLLPMSLAGMPMKAALVWAPASFALVVRLLYIVLAMGYVGVVLSAIFPLQNTYLRRLPLFIVLSMLAGTSNSVIIFLVTNSIFSRVPLIFQLYNFALAFGIYILGRKVLQSNLLRLSFDIIYDVRLNLITKIFYTSFQRFEKLDRGRVFATINDDTGQIGNTATIFVQLITSVITTVGAFIFLASIAFWATMVALGLVVTIATLYFFMSRKARTLLEEARDTRNEFMGLLNDMIDGFRELSLQYNKKAQFKSDIASSIDKFRTKTSVAMVRFIDAFLIGESMLIIVLGLIGFGIPRLFPDVSVPTLMSFIMVLLYLIGPINGILNTIPPMMQLRIAVKRVKDFLRDVPANLKPEEIERLDHNRPQTAEYLRAEGLYFEYDTTADREKFTVGPMNFEARKGEIVFIIGGNGSGKTTLAKLLTGLYLPKEGRLEVDGKSINNYQLGEYFSTVFSDFHLFRRIYNVDMKSKEGDILNLLVKLRLQEKVCVEGDHFSTLELSGGQRKRLALMQCFLEDAPIFLFDELAADQDPTFRRFFYRELLPELKQRGKIVIAITHDDHYFDVADRVVKMDMGRVDQVDNHEALNVTGWEKPPVSDVKTSNI